MQLVLIRQMEPDIYHIYPNIYQFLCLAKTRECSLVHSLKVKIAAQLTKARSRVNLILRSVRAGGLQKLQLCPVHHLGVPTR